MKKKAIAMFLACVLLLAPSAFAVDLYVDGVKLETDTEPTIIDGRTLVPVRAIFEALDASVLWDGEARTVTATKGDITILLTIDSTTAYVNGAAKTLDVPAKILNGRTMVPARFVAEALNAHVWWEAETETVYVATKPEYDGYTIAPPEIYTEAGDEGLLGTYMFADGEIWVVAHSYEPPCALLRNDEGSIFLANYLDMPGFSDLDFFDEVRICFIYIGNSETSETKMPMGVYLETGDLSAPIIYPGETETPADPEPTPEPEPTPTPVTPAPTPTPEPQPEPDPQPQQGTVYITPTGKRYHYDPDCGGKNSYASTMSTALSKGLTPCKKCAQ